MAPVMLFFLSGEVRSYMPWRGPGGRRRMTNQMKSSDRDRPAPRPNAAAPRNPSGAPAGNNRKAPRPTMPPRRTLTWFLLILVLNFIIARNLFPPTDAPVTVPYTLFREQVTRHNVAAIFSRGERITGHFRAPITYPATADSTTKAQPKRVSSFATTLPS